jgi:hypothetical protein
VGGGRIRIVKRQTKGQNMVDRSLNENYLVEINNVTRFIMK